MQDQRYERMDEYAAQSLMKMIYAARSDGVWLVPVSGFRSLASQSLLFNSQIQRRGSIEEASKVSAPPGYSEHHTGFAIDLTDGGEPLSEDITLNFEKSRAFKWLQNRAREFDFEMSFKINNQQGIMYEPWHWRYFGSPEARSIFANVRNQSK
jgi:D-alanyl-D-alanine carboxypeptidase